MIAKQFRRKQEAGERGLKFLNNEKKEEFFLSKTVFVQVVLRSHRTGLFSFLAVVADGGVGREVS